MEGVKEKWKGRKELDTKTKKRTAINLTDVAKMSKPDQGIPMRRWQGLVTRSSYQVRMGPCGFGSKI